MLTISQLAAYAGVTVRAVRHYHAKGLLPEPTRDHSGYRRYDAAAVVELIRIRTLAEAGVPLARVQELLAAGDGGVRRGRRRDRPPPPGRDPGAAAAPPSGSRSSRRARASLCRRRRWPTSTGSATLAIPERMVGGERDAWILVAAQLPERMEMYIQNKREQLEDPSVVDFYRDLDAVVDWEPGNPGLPALADRLVAQLEAVDDAEWQAFAEDPMSDDLVALLDSMFLDQVPIAAELRRLLEERGWTGWTRLERLDPSPRRPANSARSASV